MNPKKSTIVKFSAIIISILLLLIFNQINRSINNAAEKTFSVIRGELEPDTNIIVIHITENDLAAIGPWPIKRSYYALLINKLKNAGVKKIGLEIFLSARFVTQTIYDNTLKNEIEKAGNVVLSSVAGSVVQKSDNFVTDSLSFPSPKLLDRKIKTGSLNFLRNDGIIIPVEIRYSDTFEKSFSVALYDSIPSVNSFEVNFISSWKKFRNYSFLDFFNKALRKNLSTQNFKEKIVLIGLSDTQIASSFNSYYEDEIPGIALHAFALDNLMNDRFLKQDLKNISAVIFVLLIFLTLFLTNKKKSGRVISYTILFLFCIGISFVFYSFLYFQISVSFFFIPFVVLLTTEFSIAALEKTNLLRGVISEREVLQRLLSKKEHELDLLKTDLNKSNEKNSENLKQRIFKLEKDISRLKSDEEDEQSAVEYSNSEIINFNGIIYKSKIMNELVQLIKKAASTDTTALIIGESGTGKELVAKAIHSLSDRKDKPFITLNCAALSENLLESELFGYVKGAFTGANQDKKGKFEAADKGTVFLDEIGETSENFQVKLLRVLQSGEIEKVGSTEQLSVNVRIIAATNKNLDKEVREKNFREDLFYRLNVFRIDIPPLRNRREDIEALAIKFIENENPNLKISKAVLRILNEYNWKGNVRELEAVMKRVSIFASSENRELIQVADLPKEMVKISKYNFEDLVLESLRNKKFSHSSISETAKELGNVNRTLISENFRGIVFKIFYENKFDRELASKIIAGTEDNEIFERVYAKLQTYITNIENDLSKNISNDLSVIRQQFTSKYKNLPAKFHIYQDEIIKHLKS